MVEEGDRPVAGGAARFVRYRFDSPIRDSGSKPLSGHGIVATLRTKVDAGIVIYHVKLDNHGDRDDVGWKDLDPFTKPIEGR